MKTTEIIFISNDKLTSSKRSIILRADKIMVNLKLTNQNETTTVLVVRIWTENVIKLFYIYNKTVHFHQQKILNENLYILSLNQSYWTNISTNSQLLHLFADLTIRFNFRDKFIISKYSSVFQSRFIDFGSIFGRHSICIFNY